MSVPTDSQQQNYKHEVNFCDTMGKVFRASLIVLLLIIMGLLLKVAFKTSSGPTDNLEVIMELSRLRVQAARNEELMMRLYESLGERKPESFKFKG